MREPDGLTYAVLARTRRTRRMPRWANPERWLSMAVITRPALAPPMRVAWPLIIALLVLALAAGGAIVGSRLFQASAVPIPEGGAAVFAYGGFYGDQMGDIFTIRADGTDTRQLTGGPGKRSQPTWSRDGRRIAYRLWQNNTDSVVVMDAGGGNPITLNTSPVLRDEFCNERWNLTWSPDGTSLIFPTTSACQSGYDLNSVKADGRSPATRLLAPGTNSLYAAWSPDGSRLAYLGQEAGSSIGLYMVDVGSNGVLGGGLAGRLIGPDLGPDLSNPLGRPYWSPDSSELVVAGPEGVFVVPADGSPHRLVADGYNPTWSPDGKRLAFFRTVDPSEYWNGRPCTARTWVVDAVGTNLRQLEELGDGCEFPPTWSPDGTRLASSLIAPTRDDPNLSWRLGIVTVDGNDPPMILADASSGTWQPVAAPLPPAPSFPASSSTP